MLHALDDRACSTESGAPLFELSKGSIFTQQAQLFELLVETGLSELPSERCQAATELDVQDLFELQDTPASAVYMLCPGDDFPGTMFRHRLEAGALQ